MTPTPNGDNVILTYQTSIYTLKQIGSQYKWIKPSSKLSISREDHVQLLVAGSTIKC